MFNVRQVLFFILLCTSFFQAFSQMKAVEYTAGFTTLTLVDSLRLYKPNTSQNDLLHYRPLDLDIWYPSQDQKGSPLVFGDLLRLFEQRANTYQDKKKYTGITEELAVQFSVESGLDPAYGKQLLKTSTNSYRNSVPLREEKPLVLYMAGLNGMSFENFKLFEHLAENGYVVVSISSIGSYPGDMTSKKADMLEQVYDAEAAIKALRKAGEINIDFESIGVMGCSWGGISAAVLASRNPEIKALVSLDGSEIYYYGESDEDDKNLDEIFSSGLLNKNSTRLSYLYFQSGIRSTDFFPSREYNFYKELQGSKYYFRFLNSRHEDFTSIPFILNASNSSVNTYSTVKESSLLFLNQALKGDGKFKEYHHELKKTPHITSAPLLLSDTTTDGSFLKGIVRDKATNEPLPFVNIGLIHNEVGTVTNENGAFEMHLAKDHWEDSVKVSIVGFKARVFIASELLKEKSDINIKLEKDIRQLEQVVITARKLKSKTIGNETTSKFLSAGFNYKQLGAEMGIKVNIRKKPTFVDAFNFNISYNRLSSKAWFRLNIYAIENGKPFQNVLMKNITIPIEAKQTGKVSVDLKPYDIVLNDDVIVSLEWVKNEGDPQKGEAIFFSLGFLSGGTFVKTSSQGKIKKYSNMGVGFNLDVRY